MTWLLGARIPLLWLDGRLVRWGFLAVVGAVSLLWAMVGVAAADGTDEQPVPHTLEVVLTFPDTGLAAGETICVALYPDDGSDLQTTQPQQTACLAAGEAQIRFANLDHGPYRAVVSAAESQLAPARYQGQIVAVSVPDAADVNTFQIDLPLVLEPTFAGVTGSIEVNVYGCPPGTNGGGDATVWRAECDALIGGAPVSLSGIGTIDDVTSQEMTAQDGDTFGRVEFTNLPDGEYHLEGVLPESVAENPAYFVESSIDGGLPAAIDPTIPVAVRPTEVLAVEVFVPLDPSAAEPAPATSSSANPSIDDSTLEESAPVGPPAGVVADPLLAGMDESVSGGLSDGPTPMTETTPVPDEAGP